MSRSYSCIVCGVPFKSLSAARFPDFYCSSCYAQWREDERKPWLRELIRAEVRERVRAHRRRKQGISYVEVSLDEIRGLA